MKNISRKFCYKQTNVVRKLSRWRYARQSAPGIFNWMTHICVIPHPVHLNVWRVYVSFSNEGVNISSVNSTGQTETTLQPVVKKMGNANLYEKMEVGNASPKISRKKIQFISPFSLWSGLHKNKHRFSASI